MNSRTGTRLHLERTKITKIYKVYKVVESYKFQILEGTQHIKEVLSRSFASFEQFVIIEHTSFIITRKNSMASNRIIVLSKLDTKQTENHIWSTFEDESPETIKHFNFQIDNVQIIIKPDFKLTVAEFQLKNMFVRSDTLLNRNKRTN